MRSRSPSFTDALVDARYRLDALVRRSATVTVYAATHRNGSQAWLKLPVTKAAADGVALEARIANAIGSPLTVRDDGVTADGLPYLVLDPPEVESIAVLRARGTMPLQRAMAVGDALVGGICAMHEIGYVTAGLDDEDILVLANGEVALLGLHTAVEATPEGIAADVGEILRVLSLLIAECTDMGAPPSTRDALARVLGDTYSDLATLRSAWRAAAPEPINAVTRPRSSSLEDIDGLSNVLADDHVATAGSEEEPEALSTREHRTGDSMIEYLGGGAPAPPTFLPAPGDAHKHSVMYAPLSRVPEMPRLVHATSTRSNDRGARSRRPALVAAMIAAPLAVVALVVGLVVPRSSNAPAEHAPVLPPATSALPQAAVPAPAAADVPAGEPLELDDTAGAKPSDTPTGVLRTEGAPVGRRVFLDGAMVGGAPLSVTTPCGRHVLQMNRGAPAHPIEIPCGGERVVQYDRTGHWSLK